MAPKQLKKITQDMKKYSENQFKLYCDETGWEEWMENHISGTEPTESEINKIEKIQKNIWFMAFN